MNTFTDVNIIDFYNNVSSDSSLFVSELYNEFKNFDQINLIVTEAKDIPTRYFYDIFSEFKVPEGRILNIVSGDDNLTQLIEHIIAQPCVPKTDKILGYHNVTIPKGTYGESSKIEEELRELFDAEQQGVKIMIHCELADLYGALEAVAEKYGLTIDDLSKMSSLTKRAFASGVRK